MSKYAETYRETMLRHFENHLKEEKRVGDNKLVQSPEGLSAKSWQVAIDISMIIRIAQKGNAEVSKILAVDAILEMHAHEPELLMAIWPLGPKQMEQQVLMMMIHLAGSGFGPILFGVSRLVAMTSRC